MKRKRKMGMGEKRKERSWSKRGEKIKCGGVKTEYFNIGVKYDK